MGVSVRDRLRNLALERGQPFELLLTRYALERLLYRLSTTEHRERFVLKGAMLLTAWFDDPLRPTRDLDLLGVDDPDPDKILGAFQEICGVQLDDGVTFDVEGLTVERTREQTETGGLRLKTTASIGGAKVRVVIDIGFGDAVEPGFVDGEIPVLLDLPAPRLRVYPRESVVAEKFQAMVALGRANSRMKDLYDVWVLSRSYQFKGNSLARAIAATFKARTTEIPVEQPDALTRAFADDPGKKQQWESFVADVSVQPGELGKVVDDLAAFLIPHAKKARKLEQGKKVRR
jgi:predicted nucleotidyltransferase component of viral defense system